jgi:hypothetical protein
MRLTRRDAIVAALAGGVGGAFGMAVRTAGSAEGDTAGETDIPIGTAIAVGEVVYPTPVEGVPEFVETYVTKLPDARQDAIGSTARDLEAYTQRRRGRQFDSLSRSSRDSVLRSLGVARGGSDPDGTLAERVRYDLVNQLLLGLYTSPTGSELVGIENPTGHPGGYQSYQKSPDNQ